MDYHEMNRALAPLFRSFFIVLLGVLVIIGWGILFLAGFNLILPTFPALFPVSQAWQALISGCFLAVLQYPLLVLLILILAAWLLHRSGWDAWF